MGFLGHHGLLRHSLAAQDHEAARDHAQAAERAYPGSAWLQEQKKELAVRQQDWGTALALTRKRRRKVAAFATAAARASSDAATRSGLCQEGGESFPGLAPAVVAYAAGAAPGRASRAPRKRPWRPAGRRRRTR